MATSLSATMWTGLSPGVPFRYVGSRQEPPKSPFTLKDLSLGVLEEKTE